MERIFDIYIRSQASSVGSFYGSCGARSTHHGIQMLSMAFVARLPFVAQLIFDIEAASAVVEIYVPLYGFDDARF